jgi:hypothetical protein
LKINITKSARELQGSANAKSGDPFFFRMAQTFIGGRTGNSLLQQGRLREENVVFEVDMRVEVVLELLEHLVRDREGVADIVR